jgi:hypothetical protein
MNSYKAFGLNIASELSFPELAEETFSTHDVVIRYGQVPKELEKPHVCKIRHQASPGEFLLNIKTVTRYYITQGKEIIIEKAPDTDEDTIRLYLLGSAMGALLHQRGFFVLHGNAIASNGACTVVTGNSGAGKSTLATAFYQQGYRILADDVCAISMETGVPMVIPGFPQLKIWAETANQLQLPTTELRQVRPNMEKYAVPTHEQFTHEPLPLSGIYILSKHNQSSIETTPLSGIHKIDALKNQTYRYAFLKGLGLLPKHLKHMGQLAATTKIKKIQRSDQGFAINELMTIVTDNHKEKILEY